jgi:hypothetical protein
LSTASITRTWMPPAWLPSVSVAAIDQVLLPAALAALFQLAPPSTDTCTRSPAARLALSVPEMVWLGALVMKSPSTLASLDSAMLAMVVAGALVNTCTCSADELVPELPARSVAMAVMKWVRWFIGVALLVVICQVPSTATTLPISMPPSNSVTLAPTSAVPLKVGRVTAVMSSESDAPLSLPASRSGVDGTDGAVWSRT